MLLHSIPVFQILFQFFCTKRFPDYRQTIYLCLQCRRGIFRHEYRYLDQAMIQVSEATIITWCRSSIFLCSRIFITLQEMLFDVVIFSSKSSQITLFWQKQNIKTRLWYLMTIPLCKFYTITIEQFFNKQISIGQENHQKQSFCTTINNRHLRTAIEEKNVPQIVLPVIHAGKLYFPGI